MRFQLDFDSGSPGGHGGWVLIALAGVIAAMVVLLEINR